MHNDEDLAVNAYKSWGFENISKQLIEILNIWAKQKSLDGHCLVFLRDIQAKYQLREKIRIQGDKLMKK